jgi:hypothetical protein
MGRAARAIRSVLCRLIALAALGCGGNDPSDDSGPAASRPSASSSAGSAVESSRGAPARSGRSERTPHPANRLARETSPYLLLYAHNPVDWHPWGEEALEMARRENKLIFLSIGFSSCYWCHVMERESFSDEAIAAYMNEFFVCIKVDREERPDIDNIYMTSLQEFQRLAAQPPSAGWPLSMFLTPDAEPILGGSYFPPEPRDGLRGFFDVLRYVHQQWIDHQDEIRQQGALLALRTKEIFALQAGQKSLVLDPALPDRVARALAAEFDPEYGGFGRTATVDASPKFPDPSILVFLLDRVGRAGGVQDIEMLSVTLDRMAQGGMRDHVGGGFHRYSTDRFWRIPHFEKMLYDQGQLAALYAAAFELTGEPEYRRVAEATLDFVLREMTSPEGGFYSALDAEADGVEGKYYVWTTDELTEALPPEQAALVLDIYADGGVPNFDSRHVLAPRIAPDAAATRHNLSAEALDEQRTAALSTLWAVRSARQRPLLDTKVLASWNGLMIGGLAEAGRIFERPDYIDAARSAADFLLSQMRADDGRLLRARTAGQSHLNAYLEDYAFVAAGLIALYRATDDRQWLDRAAELTDQQIEWFWDESSDGFYFTSHDHEKLFVRTKDFVDAALPSGNSVAAENLLYLAGELNRPDYADFAQRTALAAQGLLDQAPILAPRMAAVLAELSAGTEP